MTAYREPATSSENHDAAIKQYRERAPYYDFELALLEPIRRIAISRLALRPGDVVIDVGCGTGLSLELLRERVGPGGRIVGIEQCPEMLERARACVRLHRWRNVTLIEGSAESVEFDAKAQGALFHFTHDILRAPRAVANVASHLGPGAHVVASGLQWANVWAWPVNLMVLSAALHSVTSLQGLDRPWSHLERHVARLQVDSMLAGSVYLARGEVRGA